MKRIADFTLGQYRRSASPADLAAFDAAFQNYATAVYQSYFSKYAGQTLKVTGSQARSADDFIVSTQLIDPNDRSGQQPLEVDFRVRTDTGKPVVVDFSVSGIWLALEERDQFTSFLGQNNGNINALIADLTELGINSSAIADARSGPNLTHEREGFWHLSRSEARSGRIAREHARRTRGKRPARLCPREALIFDLVGLIGVDAETPLLVRFVILVIAFEPFDMAVASSKASIWVAMRSRNQRSWLMIMAQLRQIPPAPFPAPRSVSTSRSLVGSSSKSRLAPDFSILARCTRLRSPPDS